MCASYGLGGYLADADTQTGLDPLDERESRSRLHEWWSGLDGKAAITGRIARNFNPVISAADGERELMFGWWWLWLDGSGPAAFDAFNSRDDRLTRSWHGPFQHRALLPASWYVEKGRTFRLPGEPVFAIAAITSTVLEAATGKELLTYSMVTRGAVGEAVKAHSRMPLVLPAALHDEWLDPHRVGDARLVDQMIRDSEELCQSLTADPEPEPTPAEPTLF